jgi:hypothetical protein
VSRTTGFTRERADRAGGARARGASGLVPTPGHDDLDPPWWANPAWLVAGFVLPVFFLVFLIPTLFGTRSLDLKSAVYFAWTHFGLGVLFFTSLVIGAVFGNYVRPDPAARPNVGGGRMPWVSEPYLEAVGLATIVAYCIWFRGFLVNPAELVALFTGSGGNVRAEHKTIGGITTLAQAGVAYVILYFDRLWGVRQPFSSVRPHVYLAVIVVWTLFRVYAWSERLALIELVVPIGLYFFVYRNGGLPRAVVSSGSEAQRAIDRRPVTTRLFWWGAASVRRFGPVLGLGAAVAYFAFTEYFRSWSAAYQYTSDRTFWDFATTRFVSYYYTALNNGAGLLSKMDWPTYDMGHVMAWLYRFPALIGPIFRFTFDYRPQDGAFLVEHADVEFNNMSGVFTFFYDLGIGGAVLYGLVWGMIAGYGFSCARARRGFPRLIYPLLFIALLEAMRIPYLGDPRVFPVVLVLVVGYLLFRPVARDPGRVFTRVRGRSVQVVGSRGLFGSLALGGRKR